MTDFNPLLARRVVTHLGRTQNAIDGALKKFSMLTTDVLEALELLPVGNGHPLALDMNRPIAQR